MSIKVDVKPQLLEWAVLRSGREPSDLWTKSMPPELFEAWVSGDRKPTLKQLQAFAAKTYTPVGYLMLSTPPVETVPIADHRAGRRRSDGTISANLRETIYQCQDRLDWYRNRRVFLGEGRLQFVGSARLNDEPRVVAARIGETVGWSAEVRSATSNPTDALAALRNCVEDAGILVAISGIVGSNTHRVLDPGEFKGFALVDDFAALVFLNGTDFPTSKVFTLAHELAHVWLKESGISDPEAAMTDGGDVIVEQWCNRVAAELLVPAAEFADVFDRRAEIGPEAARVARHFRVSTQVILGRCRETGLIGWDQYLALLQSETDRVTAEQPRRASGGNFYNSKPVQLSRRFTRELISSTLEGATSYKDAFRMLNIAKTSTFDNLATELGVL